MAPSITKYFPPGGFARAAAGLAGASILAQAIGVLSAPVLARLFEPAQIGALALFSSVAGLLGIFAGGRWHLAFAPAAEPDRTALLSLTAATTIAFTLTLTLLAWPLGPALARGVGTSRAFWAWLAPMGAALMAMNQALRWLVIAEGRPARAGRALVIRPAVAATCQILAGVSGADEAGLVLGAMAGWLAADLLLLHRRRFERSAARIASAARAWRRYPAQALPIALATQAAIALPEFYIAARHGAPDVGLYAMVVRLLAVPVAVLGEAVSALWWQRAASLPAGPPLRRLFDRLVLALGLAALAGAAVVVAFGPALFGLVLGRPWARAGELARLIVPYHAMRLVSAPVLSTGAALGRLGPAARWSAIDLGLALAACGLGIGLGLSLEAWLGLYAGLGTASRIAAIWLMREQAAGRA